MTRGAADWAIVGEELGQEEQGPFLGDWIRSRGTRAESAGTMPGAGAGQGSSQT